MAATIPQTSIFDSFSPFISTFSLLMRVDVNLLKPTGHVMHQQFNIQQLYVLPTL